VREYFGLELHVLGDEMENVLLHVINDFSELHEGDLLLVFDADLKMVLTFCHQLIQLLVLCVPLPRVYE
jgi:hypothetical protein